MKFPSRRPFQAATLVVATSVSGFLFASGSHGGSSFPPVDNPKWKAECVSCHVLYHPALLPERSWRKLMQGLDQHFGENASVDAATQREIADFLVANSADRSNSRRAQKIMQTIPTGATPLRSSETGYFIRKHDELSAAVWKREAIGSKANCVACHAGAADGNFDEHAVHIPR